MVLLSQIYADPNPKGLKIKNIHIKLQAFADCLAIILEDPLNSISTLSQLTKLYGQILGFKINSQKTYIMTKNISGEKSR